MSTRELTFSKIDGTWYYVIGNDQPSTQYEMPASTIPILELASKGNNQVALKLLRKNTLEKVKLSLGRVRYLTGVYQTQKVDTKIILVNTYLPK